MRYIIAESVETFDITQSMCTKNAGWKILLPNLNSAMADNVSLMAKSIYWNKLATMDQIPTTSNARHSRRMVFQRQGHFRVFGFLGIWEQKTY